MDIGNPPFPIGACVAFLFFVKLKNLNVARAFDSRVIEQIVRQRLFSPKKTLSVL